MASLGRGFARRGAPSLVLGLWNLDDAATAELTTGLYRELAEGAAPGAALARAAAAYRAGAPSERAAHPAYWAGLVYYGLEVPLGLGKGGWLGPTSWLWGFGLVLLAGAIGLRRKKRRAAGRVD